MLTRISGSDHHTTPYKSRIRSGLFNDPGGQRCTWLRYRITVHKSVVARQGRMHIYRWVDQLPEKYI